MRNILFAFVGVILAIGLLIFTIRLFSGNEDFWFCQEGVWVKHGNPAAPMPSENCDGSTANPTETPQPKEVNIIVEEPTKNSIVGQTFSLKGEARVFENQLNYKIVNQSGDTITSGNIMANANEMGEYGPFSNTITLPSETPPKIILQVFDYSAKDGNMIDLVEINLNYVRSGR